MTRPDVGVMRELSPEAKLSMSREHHSRTCISVVFHDGRRNDIVTLLNIRYPTTKAMRDDYVALRAEFEEADADLLVDLYVDCDLLDTFLIRRQSLQHLQASVKRAAAITEFTDPLIAAEDRHG